MKHTIAFPWTATVLLAACAADVAAPTEPSDLRVSGKVEDLPVYSVLRAIHCGGEPCPEDESWPSTAKVFDYIIPQTSIPPDLWPGTPGSLRVALGIAVLVHVHHPWDYQSQVASEPVDLVLLDLRSADRTRGCEAEGYTRTGNRLRLKTNRCHDGDVAWELVHEGPDAATDKDRLYVKPNVLGRRLGLAQALTTTRLRPRTQDMLRGLPPHRLFVSPWLAHYRFDPQTTGCLRMSDDSATHIANICPSHLLPRSWRDRCGGTKSFLLFYPFVDDVEEKTLCGSAGELSNRTVGSTWPRAEVYGAGTQDGYAVEVDYSKPARPWLISRPGEEKTLASIETVTGDDGVVRERYQTHVDADNPVIFAESSYTPRSGLLGRETWEFRVFQPVLPLGDLALMVYSTWAVPDTSAFALARP